MLADMHERALQGRSDPAPSPEADDGPQNHQMGTIPIQWSSEG